jgi:DNA repair exonuclease SbcCD ATPase subunit
VVHEKAPILIQDESNSKAWITGLSVLAIALLVGFLWAANKEERPERTDVTVNNTEVESRPTVSSEGPTAAQDTEDVQVFVTTTERSIERLSRPDDAANQAEVEAIRARMEDLRQADQEQARAIRQELQASIARLESQAAAPQTNITNVTTDGEDTTVTTQTSGSTTVDASQNQAALDQLTKRIDETSAALGQLEMTATPEAAAEVTRLSESLAALRTKLSEVSLVSGPQQATMISQLDGDLASIESAVTSVPIQ